MTVCTTNSSFFCVIFHKCKLLLCITTITTTTAATSSNAADVTNICRMIAVVHY